MKPIEYPYELYELVYKLNFELANNENKRLLAIEDRAVSGKWLIGSDFTHIPISETTYIWLWRNINLIYEKPKLIRRFWANSHQYFMFQLDYVREEFDYAKGEVLNQEEVKFRQVERKRFLEFHFALGGLLLYKNQYSTLEYIFNYSQSSPPNYVLLPQTMTEIFIVFEEFRNDFNFRNIPIDSQYFFPDLDNLGNSHEVKFWICSYMVLLFIRQYGLVKRFIYQDFTSLPDLPDSVSVLNNWLDSLKYFKFCFDKLLLNRDLLKVLGYEEIVESNQEKFDLFFTNLEKAINAKINLNQINAEIEQEKVKLFQDSTSEIISKSFKTYSSVFQSSKALKDLKDNLKLSLKGTRTLFQKSAFSSGDVQHINFHTILAEGVDRNIIKNQIPSSFIVAKTRRYLLNKENLEKGLKQLNIDDDYKIFAFNPDYDLMLKFGQYSHLVESLPAWDFKNAIFILHRKDLPSIEFVTIEKPEEKQLSLVNEEFKIYTSVIDLNLDEDKRKEWPNEDERDIKTKAEVSISLQSIISWKKNRDVVQINIESPYEEQGILSDLSELIPFEKENKNENAVNMQ